MKCVTQTKVVWHSAVETPICDEGDMIAVILQRGGRVFGGWYANEYPLLDENDSLDGQVDDEGLRLSTGFCEKIPHCEFEDYFEFGVIRDLQCWAYMPEPRR